MENFATRHFEVRQEGDVTVVTVSDRMIVEDLQIQEMGQELFALVEYRGCIRIIINFCHVDFMSSAFFGKLINLDKKTKFAKGGLVFCNLVKKVKEVFEITKLDKLFTICDSEADALAEFQAVAS